MNYQQIYNNIISNAKERVFEGYSERHHVIPRSLGGSDDKENLVNLTAREHFICHWLLTKFTEGEDRNKMIYALRMMRAVNNNQNRYETKITARVYENIKEEYSKISSEKVSGENNGMYGKTHTEEARRKISEANKGRVQTKEEKQKQIAAQTGRKRDPFTKEWKQKLSKNHKSKQPGFNGSLSEETKRKISEKAKLRTQSEETRRKIGEAQKGSKKPKKHCVHCGRDIAVNGYARFHGDKCKSRV